MSFMWGETQNCRRYHTIVRNKFCLSRDVTGMDFCDLHLFNHVFIMKLGWGLITNPYALWVCVFRRGKWVIGDKRQVRFWKDCRLPSK
ncbi:hypothetical protein CR513_59769, partial [Mucuna pruriens]